MLVSKIRKNKVRQHFPVFTNKKKKKKIHYPGWIYFVNVCLQTNKPDNERNNWKQEIISCTFRTMMENFCSQLLDDPSHGPLNSGINNKNNNSSSRTQQVLLNFSESLPVNNTAPNFASRGSFLPLVPLFKSRASWAWSDNSSQPPLKLVLLTLLIISKIQASHRPMEPASPVYNCTAPIGLCQGENNKVRTGRRNYCKSPRGAVICPVSSLLFKSRDSHAPSGSPSPFARNMTSVVLFQIRIFSLLFELRLWESTLNCR